MKQISKHLLAASIATVFSAGAMAADTATVTLNVKLTPGACVVSIGNGDATFEYGTQSASALGKALSKKTKTFTVDCNGADTPIALSMNDTNFENGDKVGTDIPLADLGITSILGSIAPAYFYNMTTLVDAKPVNVGIWGAQLDNIKYGAKTKALKTAHPIRLAIEGSDNVGLPTIPIADIASLTGTKEYLTPGGSKIHLADPLSVLNLHKAIGSYYTGEINVQPAIASLDKLIAAGVKTEEEVDITGVATFTVNYGSW
ncbi:hypothetical protein ACXX82_09730 [Glaciimonas sp. GNP009]